MKIFIIISVYIMKVYHGIGSKVDTVVFGNINADMIFVYNKSF